ncbi:hypothetical protein KFE25_004076 [Diacronema lutheri]|uniref:Nickel/cobalt efflux system n=2 Tax=Diacronema lutheri TaxID=2081491 RepID=A0A8J5XC04_DIALT|nr:hypothetical protein KFE25_004076 [Diacronema lutheri]
MSASGQAGPVQPTLAAAGAEGVIVPTKPAGAQLRRKVAVVLVLVSLLLAAALATLGAVSAAYPSMLSPGLLALSFGLRHAVDADHIAAIDNVTRKLVADGQQPLLVGFWFSLGHSLVVCIACIVLAWSGAALAEALPQFGAYGGLFGASFSSLVLLLFGSYNALTALALYREWSAARAHALTSPRAAHGTLSSPVRVTHAHDGQLAHTHLVTVVATPAGEDGARAHVRVDGPGCLARAPCCRAIFRAVDAPWKLFPVGFLFGLGFDTAIEISLLALAVGLPTRGDGVPWPATLVLPLVFTTAMCLVDTADGLLMLYSYGWASVDRALQLWFSLALTASSAVIALAVGVMQALGIVQEELALQGAGWQAVQGLGDHSSAVGGAVVGFFVLSLAGAYAYARCCLVRTPNRV